MSVVRDMSLAESGRRKIQWVRDFMPALSGIEARFEKEKPFAGLRVTVSKVFIPTSISVNTYGNAFLSTFVKFSFLIFYISTHFSIQTNSTIVS